MSISQVKALTFDVFGTVVDWRAGLLPQDGPRQDAPPPSAPRPPYEGATSGG